MMGIERHRRQWKNTCFTLFYVCFAIHLDVSVALPAPCKLDEFHSEEGFCCNLCLPGFKLVEECTGPNQRSRCAVCNISAREYQNSPNNDEMCNRCDTCDSRHHKKESSPCTYKKNTECECEDGYVRYEIDDYEWKCKEEVKTAGVIAQVPPRVNSSYHWSFILGVVLTSGATVILLWFGIHMVKTRFPSGFKDLLHPEKPPPKNPTEISHISSPSKMDSIQESTTLTDKLLRNGTLDLPPDPPPEPQDCIPPVIKLTPLVYCLVDHVPAGRFKELVRRLHVPERDIERAERDNHTFKERQDAMLRLWGERGGGGGNLPLRLVSELLSTLRTMELGECVEAVETCARTHKAK